MKFFRPLWTNFKTAVLATAVFSVVLYVVEQSGWTGLTLAGLDTTPYAVFFGVFFIGLLMAPR